MDRKLQGYINLDIDPNTDPDIVGDLNDMYMFLDNTIDIILIENVLEHVPDTLKAMQEFHRVLKPDGILTIEVPHAQNPNLFSTPDHYKGFTYTTFSQFYQDAHKGYPKFRLLHRRLYTRSSKFQWLADRYPLKVEYLSWLIQVDRIRATLTAIK